MNKKIKFIVLIIVSVLISVLIPVILSIIPNKEKKEVDLKQIQNQFQKTLEETVVSEKIKTESEVKASLAKKDELESEIIFGFSKGFTKYYGEDTKNFKTQYSPDKKLWKMIFSRNEENELCQVNDTGKEGWNAYELEHEYELKDDMNIIKQTAKITVMRDNKNKFNIYENDILIQYFNGILGREMTDKDKNAINIKVNMDLASLTTIDDLKNYIYNNNSLKIDDMIIESENKEDVEKQRTTVTFNISSEKTLTQLKDESQ